MTQQPKFSNFSIARLLRLCFLGGALTLIIFNTTTLYKEIHNLGLLRRKIPYSFNGDQFLGLKAILKDVQRVGYDTDKSLDVNKNALQFAQAQYILAPIILDLNNTDDPFVLFDYSDQSAAFKKIKEAGLIPIKRNQLGIILTANPKVLKKPKAKMRVPLWDKTKSSAEQEGNNL